MVRHARHYVLAILVLCILLAAIVLVFRAFGIEPFSPWICLNSTPSSADVDAALKAGLRYRGYDWDESLVFSARRLECPHWRAVGTPKMTFLLSVWVNGELVSEGQLGIGYEFFDKM